MTRVRKIYPRVRVTCPVCGGKRMVAPHRPTNHADCVPDQESRAEHGLPPGDWRLDPFKRIVVFVPSGPGPTTTRHKIIPCGTTRAYGQHLYHGEKPCDPCKEAQRLKRREERAAA